MKAGIASVLRFHLLLHRACPIPKMAFMMSVLFKIEYHINKTKPSQKNAENKDDYSSLHEAASTQAMHSKLVQIIQESSAFVRVIAFVQERGCLGTHRIRIGELDISLSAAYERDFPGSGEWWCRRQHVGLKGI